MTEHDLLSTAQAAAVVGMSPIGIQRACQQERLPAQKVGSTWIIRRADLLAWFNDAAQHKPGPKGPRTQAE